MTKKAIVLGCGRVGATIVRDLASDSALSVTATDVSAENLEPLSDVDRVTVQQVDLADEQRITQLVGSYDVVVGALPSRLGFQTLRAVIDAGKPYCDISFMPEDACQLHGRAVDRGVTALVDCGVAPGLSNLMVGHIHQKLDRTDRAAIYVGGMPKARHWPFEYKAPFAPSDVIEEYTRPVRMVERGKIVVKSPLTEPELLEFDGIGTLEAVLTDGLRSLIETLDIPVMVEKTLRYPGHFELMRVLRETGFFSKEEIDVDGTMIRPLDLSSKLLFSNWAFQPGEEEFTVMRVDVEGREGDQDVRYSFRLYDEYDRSTGTSSMARTTGFPATILARLLAFGEFRKPGVLPLELVAQDGGVVDHMFAQLDVRGVSIQRERVAVP